MSPPRIRTKIQLHLTTLVFVALGYCSLPAVGEESSRYRYDPVWDSLDPVSASPKLVFRLLLDSRTLRFAATRKYDASLLIPPSELIADPMSISVVLKSGKTIQVGEAKLLGHRLGWDIRAINGTGDLFVTVDLVRFEASLARITSDGPLKAQILLPTYKVSKAQTELESAETLRSPLVILRMENGKLIRVEDGAPSRGAKRSSLKSKEDMKTYLPSFLPKSVH